MQPGDNATAAFSVPYTRGALPAIESPSIDPSTLSETRIAFVLYNHNSNGQYQIFRYAVDSQTLTQLTSDPSRKLRSKYSPDGTKILFIKEVADGTGTLWTMNADGSGEQQIGADTNVDFATWSPAGTKIAFTTPTETVMIDSSGTNRQSLGERIGRFSWGRSPNFDTPVGTNVQDGFCDFQITFANVSLEGTTSVNPVASSSIPPSGGFRIGNVAFEVTTTAVVAPPINVCFQTNPNISLATFNRLSMLHGENGVMVDRTTSRDFANKLICGTVTSLSPFALGEVIDAGLPSITGVVLDDQNAPLAGVSVDLTGSGSDSILTDSEGRFSFVNLQPAGNYNVSPKLAGYIFDEYNTDFVAVSGENTVAFSGTPQTFTISGTVGTENSLLIAGATVLLTGDVNRTTTTDANGAYSFTNLPADGNYQVTPFAAGVALSPATQIIAPLSADASGINFGAFAPTAADGFVSGRVMTANGSGIRNATVSITDTTTGTTHRVRTGTFGYYRFDALETGRTYVVTVGAKRYRFTNDSRVISLTDSVADADFIANPSE
jgi:hypothetical protein